MIKFKLPTIILFYVVNDITTDVNESEAIITRLYEFNTSSSHTSSLPSPQL